MITGQNYSNQKKQQYTVSNAAGQSSFPLTEKLTEHHLVFVGGVLTDMPYSGVGTLTLTFTGGYKLEQGDILTIK